MSIHTKNFRKRYPDTIETFTQTESYTTNLNFILHSFRCHQWVKNILLFAPMFLMHSLSAQKLAYAFGGFIAFCAISSATYIINDIIDVKSDRLHPDKRKRSIASGNISLETAILSCAFLLVTGFATAVAVGTEFLFVVCMYTFWSLSYSFFLKKYRSCRRYHSRVPFYASHFAGSVATDINITRWLLAFSTFCF